jgi:hypothetical protein
MGEGAGAVIRLALLVPVICLVGTISCADNRSAAPPIEAPAEARASTPAGAPSPDDIRQAADHENNARDYLITGHHDLGLIEVDQALELNPKARSAQDLKRSLLSAQAAAEASGQQADALPLPEDREPTSTPVPRPTARPAPTVRKLATTDDDVRHAVTGYGCTGTTIADVIILAAMLDSQEPAGSSVTGSTSNGRIKLVSVYTKSQGGGRSAEYKFSYDTQSGKVVGENAAGQQTMHALAAARCFP